MWRHGGKRNEFKFVNCPLPFYGQHDIRRIKNGNITLFDNGRNAVSYGARALEFELDEVNKIATLKWSYTYDSTMSSGGHGNVQRLEDGNTLINFGGVNNDIVFFVVDALGNKLFQLSSPDHLDSYRSFYYPSLPWKINRPEIICFDSLGVTYLKTKQSYASYQWSDSSTKAVIPVKKGVSSYSVFVPYGEGGFISSEKFVVNESSIPCRRKAASGQGKKRVK